MLVAAAGASLLGCGKTQNSGETAEEAKGSESALTESSFVSEEAASAEFEDGKMDGNARSESKKADFSGSGYAAGLEKDGDSVSVKLNIGSEGFYDLVFTLATEGGYKENYVSVNGEAVGTLKSDSSAFTKVNLPHIYLKSGENEVSVSKYWGYMDLDKVSAMTAQPFDTSIYDVPATLVNPNASENAKRLMSYLSDSYGDKIISGQYSDNGAFGQEMATIWKATGKFPAMVGLDMMNYSTNNQANGATGMSIDHAIEAWENNSIVTMCWHWTTPQKYVSGNWYSAFYKEHTKIDLDKIMDGTDKEGHDLLVKDMDTVAKELKKLADKDIPVLWRPLHEASGGWFWWGNCKAESYVKLYREMYDKFTNEYGLNNLIWVWNGQNKDWYPGDDVTDIIGWDVYPGEHVYTSQYPIYAEALEVTDAKKIITMSENGCLADPDLCKRDGAMWSYVGTWSGEFVTQGTAFNTYSEQYTEEDMLKKFYTHDIVITRDELPDLKSYPIGE